MKRLNAARSGGRRGNDDIELDAPGANELLGDSADLVQRRRVTSILEPVEQLPDFGAAGVALLPAKLVVSEKLAAAGVEVEDAAVGPWPSTLRGFVVVTKQFYVGTLRITKWDIQRVEPTGPIGFNTPDGRVTRRSDPCK